MKTPVIDLITGARPNFMKVAPLYHALKEQKWCTPRIIHTGQHYSDDMWRVFLSDFDLPEPHSNLNAIPPGSSLDRLEQARLIQKAYERSCRESRPDFVVVVGDVNSTLGCARAAHALRIPVGHVEAGLRSGDYSMPEELNRIETDKICDVLWTPSLDGNENLAKERVPGKVELAGNIMIDSYLLLKDKIELLASKCPDHPFAVITFHRPENVDSPEALSRISEFILAASKTLHLIFPTHPRTKNRLSSLGLLKELQDNPAITILPPLSYAEFMGWVSKSTAVITDSGGVQEETTYLGIPCFTIRKNTERPITISEGTNRLISINDLPGSILDPIQEILVQNISKRRNPPKFWDGKTAHRIAESIRARIREESRP